MNAVKKKKHILRKQEEKQKTKDVLPVKEEPDPIHKTEDYIHTFVQRHADVPHIQPLKAEATRALDNIEFKFKEACDKAVDEWFKANPGKKRIEADDLAHLMDVVGNNLEVHKTIGETKLLALTQLQLIARCSTVTRSLRVEPSYHELSREIKNIFVMNVYCERLGGQVIDVREDTVTHPSFVVIALNPGHHDTLTTRNIPELKRKK